VEKRKKKEKNNYAGSKTLPASNKEKETHWPKSSTNEKDN